MSVVQPLGFCRLASCFGLLAVLVLSGCAQVYKVRVDARQNPEIQSGHSYRLVVKPTGGGGDEAGEKRTEALIHKALGGHGMYEAENPEKAEVTVEVSVEVGAKRVLAESVASRPGSGVASIEAFEPRIVPESNGKVIGVPEGPGIIVRDVYEKRLTIVAREGPAAVEGKEHPPRELWRVEAKVDDRGDGVDEVLPVLVGAAVDHINSDNTTQQTRRVSEKSEPVTFVTGGK
jgi:hypothetical protein